MIFPQNFTFSHLQKQFQKFTLKFDIAQAYPNSQNVCFGTMVFLGIVVE